MLNPANVSMMQFLSGVVTMFWLAIHGITGTITLMDLLGIIAMSVSAQLLFTGWREMLIHAPAQASILDDELNGRRRSHGHH